MKGVANEGKITKLTDENVSARWEWSTLLNAADNINEDESQKSIFGFRGSHWLESWTGVGFRKYGRRKEGNVFPVIFCCRWRQKHVMLAWEGSAVKQRFVFCFLKYKE